MTLLPNKESTKPEAIRLDKVKAGAISYLELSPPTFFFFFWKQSEKKHPHSCRINYD